MSDLPCQIDDNTGNCWAACISSITGIPFDELKVDVGDPSTWDRDKERWLHNRMMALLHERGWTILHSGTRIPAGVSIAVGPSGRGEYCHSWIAKDGKPYFDPHPSREFTETVIQFEVPVRIVGVLPEATDASC